MYGCDSSTRLDISVFGPESQQLGVEYVGAAYALVRSSDLSYYIILPQQSMLCMDVICIQISVVEEPEYVNNLC